MNMPGDIEATLECVSISSASSDMGPLVVRKRNKSPEIEISEEERLVFLPPIYGDTGCIFGKGENMSWYQIYKYFTQTEFLEDLPDRHIYIYSS